MCPHLSLNKRSASYISKLTAEILDFIFFDCSVLCFAGIEAFLLVLHMQTSTSVFRLFNFSSLVHYAASFGREDLSLGPTKNPGFCNQDYSDSESLDK